ncbi:AAA family ATPase [Nonomuraea rubra]|uniref:AAA family ATPase n=1 Tax=Nonomuraea rubra TaxID=46180 RepID=UPI003622C8F4
MFVGRTAELASLRAELRAAGGGSVRRAVVEGPEGIGKTALIRHALDGEAGVRVLAVSGEESERELGLGVVRQLMDEAALLGLGLGLGTDERAGGGARRPSRRTLPGAGGSGRRTRRIPARPGRRCASSWRGRRCRGRWRWSSMTRSGPTGRRWVL